MEKRIFNKSYDIMKSNYRVQQGNVIETRNNKHFSDFKINDPNLEEQRKWSFEAYRPQPNYVKPITPKTKKRKDVVIPESAWKTKDNIEEVAMEGPDALTKEIEEI